MHICFVINEYPPHPHGGIGSLYQDLAERLVQAGQQVTVMGVYPRRSLPPLPRKARFHEEMRAGVRVLRIPGSPSWLRYHAGALADRWRLREILRACHQEQPFDLVETADYEGLLYFGGLRGVPMVVRIHGGNLFFDKTLGREGDAFQHGMERRSLAAASHLCAVSNFAATKTLELCGMEGAPCEVVPNAVDTGLFCPAPEVPVVPGRILFVNSISPKKGVRDLVRALPLVIERFPQAHLVMAGRDGVALGQGQGGSYSRSLLEELRPGLRDRVIFTGPLDRRTGVLHALREAEVCCYPSHMETFGLAAAEAMSTGKPTIFSKAGPGPEVIKDGVEGLLCDPHSPEDIASKICEVLGQPSRAAELGGHAREKVLREFSQPMWLERNLAYYRACMGDFEKQPWPARPGERAGQGNLVYGRAET